MSFTNDIKIAYNKATIAEKFIYINIAIFLFSLFTKSFFVEWFFLKSNFQTFTSQPWTLISYAFFHDNFPHILFNLIFLYYLGNLFLTFFTKKQFINYYFLGIIVGGIAHLALQNNYHLVGASAGVMAILVGITTKIPTYEIRFNLIGGVKLWIIALIYIVLSISNGNIAHLGGALIGFIYTKQLEKGMDIGKWVESVISFFANLFRQKKQSPLRTVHKNKNIVRKPTHKESGKKQRQINKILDKIGKSGYESLNKEEKDFLFKSGNSK